MTPIIAYALCKSYTNKTKVEIDEAILHAIQVSEDYTDSKLAVGAWTLEFVDQLPAIEDAKEFTVYFVPDSVTPDINDYYEYIVVENELGVKSWKVIGHTSLDLSAYWTAEEVKAYVDENQYVLLPATSNTLGGVMIDTSTIQLADDGTISINTIASQNIQALFDVEPGPSPTPDTVTNSALGASGLVGQVVLDWTNIDVPDSFIPIGGSSPSLNGGELGG